MFFGKKNDPAQLKQLAEVLAKTVEDIFMERANISLPHRPEIEKKNIIEYNGRMRVDGMEKFNDPTFISTVNYYLNQKDMESHKALGALVIYVEQTFIVQLLKLLKYPLANDEDEEEMKDCCGTLCNIIAGRFKSEIVKLGLVELEMSHFSNYRNSAFNGVEFNYNEWDKYEINVFLGEKKEKRLVVEMTMAPVLKG